MPPARIYPTEKAFVRHLQEQITLSYKIQSEGIQIAGLPDLIGHHKGIPIYLEVKKDTTHEHTEFLHQWKKTNLFNARSLKHPVLAHQWRVLLSLYPIVNSRVGMVAKMKDCIFFAIPSGVKQQFIIKRTQKHLNVDELLYIEEY